MKFISACTLFFSVLLYLPQPWWWLEVFTHFTVLLCLVSVACLVVNVFTKHRLWITLTTCSSLLSFYPLIEFIPAQTAPIKSNLSIYNANVLSSNLSPEKILQQIQDTQPDIITLQEFSPHLQQVLSSINEKYPHQILAPQNDNFGIALYSKHPISNHQILKFNPLNLPTIEAVIAINDTQSIRILTTHPIPPLGQQMFEARNQHLKELGNQISKYSPPIIITGDFNITPFSSAFKQLIKTSMLKQARSKQGLMNTWPSKWAGIPILSIPIDHILLSDEFENFELQRLQGNGSDHRALLLNLDLHEQKVVSPVADR